MKNAPPITILIVSDDATRLGKIQERMIAWGYRAYPMTLDESLERRPPFDGGLIILDLGLPASGSSLHIPRLKALYPDSRIITLTWQNTRPLEIAVRRQGVGCYLVASADMQDLKTVVDHAAMMAMTAVPQSIAS